MQQQPTHFHEVGNDLWQVSQQWYYFRRANFVGLGPFIGNGELACCTAHDTIHTWQLLHMVISCRDAEASQLSLVALVSALHTRTSNGPKNQWILCFHACSTGWSRAGKLAAGLAEIVVLYKNVRLGV